MMTAWILSQESSCASNRVGAIITKDDRILSSGYNGTRTGTINCNEHAKNKGWLNDDGKLKPTFRLDHRKWSLMNEYHAEQNAIDNITRLGISSVGCTIFTTLSPCIECCKRISNLGIIRVVFSEHYDNEDESWIPFLEGNGIKVERISKEELSKKYNFINAQNLEHYNIAKE